MSVIDGPAVLAKVRWRIIPFAILLFFVNYLDRANISFAALQMNPDLGFGPAVYGFAAGVFFVGYFLFEIPSNLVMVRVGVRRWMARIMISWGVVATAMCLVKGERSFDILRFLLGAAEAGFIPCIMWYFGNWFPAGDRGRNMAIFMSTTALANVVGGPLSTGLMALDGAFGLRGWQIMFILEGVPSILIGIWVLFALNEKPEEANWLSPAEKGWLTRTLAEERAQPRMVTNLRDGFLDPRVITLTAVCFFLFCANFGIVFWLPQIVKSFGNLSNLQVGGLSAIPYLAAAVGMIWWGQHSDKTGDRRWHLLIAAFVGAGGLALSGLASASPLWSFIGLIFAALGIFSMFGVFWAVPGDILRGMAAAGGLALINSVGTLGGFVGPSVIGIAKQMTGGFTAPLLVLAAFAVVSGLLSLVLPPTSRTAASSRLAPAGMDAAI